MSGYGSINSNNQFISNGITITPATPKAGESVRIIYDGLLAKSGAADVLAQVGFGARRENIFDYRMVKTTTGFEATVQDPIMISERTFSPPLTICASISARLIFWNRK